MEKKNILINNIDEITMKGKNIKSDNINTNNSETNIIYKTKNITINNTSIKKNQVIGLLPLIRISIVI